MASDWQGEVLAIQIAEHPHRLLTPLDCVLAIAGAGLEGDHHTRRPKPGAGREVTLIEAEALAAFYRDYHIELSHNESRRNILTTGAPLNHLVGCDFIVGDVVLKGIELCEPCGHLATLTGKKVKPGMVHRGGLRAEILSGGTIRVGDVVKAAR